MNSDSGLTAKEMLEDLANHSSQIIIHQQGSDIQFKDSI